MGAALVEDLVDQPILHRRLATHEVVAFGVQRDLLHRLTSVAGKDLVELIADQQDLAGMDVNIRRLAREAAQGLMDHHARVGQAEAFARGPACQQQGAHARRLTNTHGAHIGADEAHGVVDGQPGGD